MQATHAQVYGRELAFGLPPSQPPKNQSAGTVNSTLWMPTYRDELDLFLDSTPFLSVSATSLLIWYLPLALHNAGPANCIWR